MSDLSNQNTDDMSMGQLASSKFLLEGALVTAANDINSGKEPNFSGGSDYSIAGDTMGSAFISSKAGGTAMQMGATAVSNSSFIQTSERVNPIFSDHKGSKKAKNALGHDLTYGELKSLAKQESRALYNFAKTGRMVAPGKKDSVFQTADDVYARSEISGQSLGGVTSHGFKALKVTPKMLVELKLVPAGIKNSLDNVDKKLKNPDANTIVSTISQNEESGVRMLNNTSGSTQNDIIRRMDQNETVRRVEMDTKPSLPSPGMGSMG